MALGSADQAKPRKLMLKSETVRRLAEGELSQAAGGVYSGSRTMPSMWSDCCPYTYDCKSLNCPF
jgi:hypothetical protein